MDIFTVNCEDSIYPGGTFSLNPILIFKIDFTRWNKTATEAMIDEMYNPDRISRVSGVSWWELGNEVYAMTEYKDGQKVDPHNIIAIGIKHALKK